MSYLKKSLELITHRVFALGVLIFLQAVALVVMIWRFNDYFVFFYAICILISLSVVLWMVNNRSHPAYKLAWTIAIMLFPIFGGFFYLFFGANRLSRRMKNKMGKVTKEMADALPIISEVFTNLQQENMTAFRQAYYIANYSYNPIYKNTLTEFLPSGEKKFARMLEELEKAQRYIFLEYFIIQPGKMWDGILSVLVAKAQQGLEVRVIYDDVGCILKLPPKYNETLEEMGIKCSVFNPVLPILTSRLNNRDHRKICVIDGRVGFTGGINLANEYINAVEKHGHWRDTAIMLKGEAVFSLTAMFLSVWDYLRDIKEDYLLFRPQETFPPAYDDGYVQPFADNPLDDEPVGQTVYLNLITKAEDYLYINTPYLIIDDEISTALCAAAKSGVDVRIMTPHIADKWYVHAQTQSYYEVLLESGVKIYEYTPGFNHAKTFVVDDKYGVVGTINLDYRSLYLHFECGVWLYRTKSVLEIKEDFLKTLEVGTSISLYDCYQISWYRRLGRSILRAFAPLM